MFPLNSLSGPWLVPACYVLGVASALFPWINAEILLLGAVPLASTQMELGWVVVGMTAGQMTGKAIVYWLSRRGYDVRGGRPGSAFERWRDRLERRPRVAAALVFVSACIGVPPFFLVSIAAGAARMAFTPFVVTGTAGRLLHFAGVALAPELLRTVL